ncbi:hypothetical protein BJL95_20870 [Methylomonas sp. LWB]|uniref:glycosyltransferase family 2 protein n=1 Tax=Methylomonas sp. LWB TaxID=1905845 RepID=UPI0008D949E3|nr:glycosyltransferase family 2 protein [Methylomonas sp. LWB]OHX37129.1 hypothetical protein BJL95_20870 [Methylomonas sp. LWB]
MKALLKELPLPNENKKGWPWTHESKLILDARSKDSPWPKISIITPSLNQGKFIEETIRSILLQNYPNLEYIVIDGGSTDNSIEIIKKYENWIHYWVSEKDEGQSHAINKGLEACTGDIIAWVNSDDTFANDTLFYVADKFNLNDANWLIGIANIIDESSNRVGFRNPPKDVTQETFLCWTGNWFPQQSTFWNRKMLELIGHLDISLHYVMDVDLWWKMTKRTSPIIENKVLSNYRVHNKSKTVFDNEKSNQELASWIYNNFILNATNKYDNFIHILHRQIYLQSLIDRLKNHIILGNVIKFWGNYINSYFSKL